MPKFSLAQFAQFAKTKFAMIWWESRDMGVILCDNLCNYFFRLENDYELELAWLAPLDFGDCLLLLRHPLHPGAAVDADRQDQASV